MKKLYTLILFIAITSTMGMAQNKSTEKADKLYNRLAYTDAVEAYQKLIKKGDADDYVYTRLAHSYFNINDTKNAEIYYKRVVDNDTVDAETVYNYAQSLKANQKFSEYNTWMKKFAQMKPSDTRAKDFMKNPDYLPQLMEKKPKFDVKNMDINSKYSDFGGVMAGNDFYFSSARNTSRKTYSWNEQPFLDLYKASNVAGTIKNADLINGDVNTKYHEGSVAITADGKRMYFDRNDYYDGDYSKSSEGINQLNLYYAENVGNTWKDVQPVPFNSKEFSTGHPALSPDGNTLYFVSDGPEGKGNSDIFKVAVNTDGTFGTPMRLGTNINTEGKEVFPFVDATGTLYFSSDAHLGLGGLDVFSAEASGSDFGTVKNMGPGINSASDDFAFTFNPETQEGFVSSNRTGGKGSDDIYQIKEIEQPCEVQIMVQVVDDVTKAPISGARVELYDGLENRLSTKTTGANGNVTFTGACDIKHVVQATMQDYESNAVDVDAANDTTVNTTVSLRPIDAIIQEGEVVLNAIYFDFDKHNIKPQAAFELDKLVSVMKKYPTMKIKVQSHTDIRGSESYNKNLSERRAQTTVQYIISQGIDKSRISGEGLGESKPFVACGSNCTEEQHQQNRRSEFLITEK